jgi:hypothetical protein
MTSLEDVPCTVTSNSTRQKDLKTSLEEQPVWLENG